MDLFELFITAFITLFVIVDPLGTTGIFAALTGKMDRAESKSIAAKACIVSVFILIFFGFIGFWLLSTLSISMSAFRIAGGLLLFVTAFRMIMGYHDPDQVNSEDSSYQDKSSLAVFPLAIPLLAGPGTMTAVILLMGEQSGYNAKFTILGAIIAVQIIAYIGMLSAQFLNKAMGPMGISILARIMGVLMAAISVQFVADGILELFVTG